ncbi:MAG: ATP-binding protein [Motiliproteus sp.]
MIFKLRTQLLILSLGLLVLPWLGYRYINDIQDFLIKGQEQAQLLTTQAIATALQDRPDLLPDLPERNTSESQNLLYAYPTDTHVLPDGFSEEWDQPFAANQFGPAAEADRLDPLAMKLRFLQRGDQLYILIQVSDRYPVYRHPGYQYLDTSDQIRLTIDEQHFVITSQAVGAIQVITTNDQWRLPQQSDISSKIHGGWVEIEGGYQIELQLPLDMVSQALLFDITVLDIDDPVNRNILEQLSISDQKNIRLLVHSPELQRLIRGLKRADRHVWILDQQRQIRAVSNTTDAAPNLLQRHSTVIDRAMNGLPAVARYKDDKTDYILAAQPIAGDENHILGVAVVEVATDEILNLQRVTLLKSAVATTIAFVVLITGLLLFSYRLTRRIRRLQTETQGCVDSQGRIVKAGLEAEQSGHDELAELGKDMSGLISRLHLYTRFLERMPRTLKHELSNPLNTISTSLEIIREDANKDQQPYLASAERGVARMTMIINGLTEAASLEEALRDEILTALDLKLLLSQYGGQFQSPNLKHTIEMELPVDSAWINGNGLRLEQLLDKLVDNALDFAPEGTPIGISLNQANNLWILELTNQGPKIQDEIKASLFDSLVTLRKRQSTGNDEQPDCHMGIGLFVVKTIAEYHGATVSALNTESGVVFRIVFPALSSDSASSNQ